MASVVDMFSCPGCGYVMDAWNAADGVCPSCCTRFEPPTFRSSTHIKKDPRDFPYQPDGCYLSRYLRRIFGG